MDLYKKQRSYSTQSYIPGQRVHMEEVVEGVWNIFMEDLPGYPIQRGLTHDEAVRIVDEMNRQVKGLGHCKDCTWWIVRESWEDLHYCTHPKVKEDILDDKVPTDGVLLGSYEDVVMYTGPEFGCVNFKQKGE